LRILLLNDDDEGFLLFNYSTPPWTGYEGSNDFSISSSVFPLVSGKKMAAVRKYRTVHAAHAMNITEYP
jgi:hypothetical protein